MRCLRRIRGGRAERNEYPLDNTAEPVDPERDVEQNNTDTIDTFRRDPHVTMVDPTIAPDDEYVEKRRDY
jgi:PBP1b-binding outer membrane lipoprotein LpoB